MALLEFTMVLGIWYYLALKNLIPFTIRLDTLQVQKVVLRMLFLIIMQELKLIHMILSL